METGCSEFSWNTASETAIGARKERSKSIKFPKPGRNTTNELSNRTLCDILQVDEKTDVQAVRGELASIEIHISEVRERCGWKLRLVGRIQCILTHVEML